MEKEAILRASEEKNLKVNDDVYALVLAIRELTEAMNYVARSMK
jgi:hypothetical protein